MISTTSYNVIVSIDAPHKGDEHTCYYSHHWEWRVHDYWSGYWHPDLLLCERDMETEREMDREKRRKRDKRERKT
jgi:hypothetical protein